MRGGFSFFFFRFASLLALLNAFIAIVYINCCCCFLPISNFDTAYKFFILYFACFRFVACIFVASASIKSINHLRNATFHNPKNISHCFFFFFIYLSPKPLTTTPIGNNRWIYHVFIYRINLGACDTPLPVQ